VYGFPFVPTSWLRDLWIAFLSVGTDAAVSFQSAAPIRRLNGFFPGPVVLTAPHGGHDRLPGGFVHQISDVLPHHVSLVDGLPVTTVERTLVDLAVVLGPRRLGDVIDDAVTKKRTLDSRIGAVLADVTRRGKPGVLKLARVLDDRGPGYVPPASELERAFFAALEAGGLPPPVRQLPLPGRGVIEGLVDAGYVDCQLLMETDGRRWHTRVKDIGRDHLRDAEATRAGWQTLRFLYEHVMDDPAEVCATIRDVRAARAGLGLNSRK
jgi:hypothetical protein